MNESTLTSFAYWVYKSKKQNLTSWQIFFRGKHLNLAPSIFCWSFNIWCPLMMAWNA